jgi:hypothetical protein
MTRSGLLELLPHGLHYVFLTQKGALTRGVPTAYAASPIKEQIATDGDPVSVWPMGLLVASASLLSSVPSRLILYTGEPCRG